MLRLDVNLIASICKYLPDKDVSNMSETCKFVNKCINNDNLWMNRFINKYGREVGTPDEIIKYKSLSIGSWKNYYKEICTYVSPRRYSPRGYQLNTLDLVSNRRLDLIILMVNRGHIFLRGRVKYKKNYLSYLELACRLGYLELVKYLDREGINFADNNHAAIGIAADKGYTNIVKYLLRWRGIYNEFVDPRRNLNYALIYACRNNHIDIINILLNWRGPGGEYVDVTYYNNTAYAYSCIYRREEIKEILLSWESPDGEKVYEEYNKDLVLAPSLITYSCPYSDV